MKRNLSYRQKVNIRFIITLLISLLIILNTVLNIVNSNFRDRKILEENLEIVELTTFLIEDNDINVAIEFLEHYKDSHHVDFSFRDESGSLIYSSTLNEVTPYRAEITAGGANYIFSIDNTHSITVDLLNQNIYYSNVVIIGLSILLIAILVISNRKSYQRISRDIEYIMHYIESEEFMNEGFNYLEFEEIYNSLLAYTQKIDTLNEQKNLSVTGLAHDIKTPLTIIKSYIDPYKNTTGSITKDKCIKAIDRISRLVDHLRQDDYAGAFYEFNLSKLIKQEVQTYYSIFNHKNMDIRLELDEDSYIRWNMKQARIVVDNLFSNAYYYSTPGSEYKITLNMVEDNLVMSLSSYGNPISKDEQQAIFKKGFRSKSTTAFNEEGEGIGLYIVKILLMQVNATISLEVEGQLNTFTIIIPAANKEEMN